MHCRRAGEKRGNDEACRRTEYDRQNNAEDAHIDLTEMELTDGISEKKVADKGRKRGGKHRHMEIFAHGVLRDKAINQYADEGRPHIKEIKTVETMRDYEDIRRKGCGVRFCFTDPHNKVTGKTTKTGVEKRTCKTAEIEIVRNQFGG